MRPPTPVGGFYAQDTLPRLARWSLLPQLVVLRLGYFAVLSAGSERVSPSPVGTFRNPGTLRWVGGLVGVSCDPTAIISLLGLSDQHCEGGRVFATRHFWRKPWSHLCPFGGSGCCRSGFYCCSILLRLHRLFWSGYWIRWGTPAPAVGDPTRTSFLTGFQPFRPLDWVQLAHPNLLCLQYTAWYVLRYGLPGIFQGQNRPWRGPKKLARAVVGLCSCRLGLCVLHSHIQLLYGPVVYGIALEGRIRYTGRDGVLLGRPVCMRDCWGRYFARFT